MRSPHEPRFLHVPSPRPAPKPKTTKRPAYRVPAAAIFPARRPRHRWPRSVRRPVVLRSSASTLSKPAIAAPARFARPITSRHCRSTSRSNQIGQAGIDHKLAARGACEHVLGDRLPQPVAVGADPNPASRQFTSDIGNKSILRSDNEPDHRFRIEPLPRYDAAAKRTGFIVLGSHILFRIGRCGRLDLVHPLYAVPLPLTARSARRSRRTSAPAPP